MVFNNTEFHQLLFDVPVRKKNKRVSGIYKKKNLILNSYVILDINLAKKKNDGDKICIFSTFDYDDEPQMNDFFFVVVDDDEKKIYSLSMAIGHFYSLYSSSDWQSHVDDDDFNMI